MELETIQSLLQSAGIEVDIKTLQNPTEEFMINLVTEYLKRFHFDGNEIAKPTPEQLNCVACDESVMNAIRAINLHAALATVCEQIFLKDLTLTDITNPGYKKACKRIKVLFNFFVYVRNKKAENEYLFDEMESRQKEMQDMIDETDELKIKLGSVRREREAKLEYKEELEKEMAKLKLELESNEKQIRKNQVEVKKVADAHQSKVQNLNDLKAKAHELHKIHKDLQGKIVKSPEEYLARVSELKQIVDAKKEERQIINDCISRKINQIRNNELAEEDVKKCNEKVMNLGEVMRKLKDTHLQLQSIKNQVNEIKVEISALERQANASKEDTTSTISMDFDKSQQLLKELQKSLSEKQKEYNKLKEQLDKLQNERAKLGEVVREVIECIAVTEQECTHMLRKYKSFFDAEIAEEIDFRRILNEAMSF